MPSEFALVPREADLETTESTRVLLTLVIPFQRTSIGSESLTTIQTALMRSWINHLPGRRLSKGYFPRSRVSTRFGRTAKFDYLAMISRLGLYDIRPGRAFLAGSTGPLKGARLLFDSPGAEPSKSGALETKVIELQSYLQVGFDTIEDALCNWQKSPATFRPFRG